MHHQPHVIVDTSSLQDLPSNRGGREKNMSPKNKINRNDPIHHESNPDVRPERCNIRRESACVIMTSVEAKDVSSRVRGEIHSFFSTRRRRQRRGANTTSPSRNGRTEGLPQRPAVTRRNPQPAVPMLHQYTAEPPDLVVQTRNGLLETIIVHLQRLDFGLEFTQPGLLTLSTLESGYRSAPFAE